MIPLTTSGRARLGCALLVVVWCSGCGRDVEQAKRAYVARGDTYLEQGNLDAAIIEYRNAVQQDARFASAYRKLSAAYARRGNDAEAVHAMETAAELLPADDDVRLDLANQLLRVGRSGDAVVQASRLLPDDPVRVEPLLVRVIDADPGQFAAYALLGRLYLAGNRLDAAATRIETVVADPKPAVGALTLLGIIRQMQTRTPDAKRAFERALAIDRHAAVAANNLAWIHAENGGNLDSALALAKTADAALPHQPEVRDTLGWVYYKKGMLPLAVATLENSVQLSPQDPTASYHLACAYEKSGDKAAARRMFDRYLALDPGSERASQVRRRLHATGD
jgi:Tfp pilus assembly protein PilF